MMDKVKRLMEAGLSTPAAIKAALDMPVSEFADKYGIPRSTATNVVNGVQRATDATVAALVAEFGGTDNEWRELLWQAMRPAHLAAS
jgi:plasmid maintenance system antidote protein VapI